MTIRINPFVHYLGHPEIYLVVEKWRDWFAKFNRLNKTLTSRVPRLKIFFIDRPYFEQTNAPWDCCRGLRSYDD